MKRFYKTVSVQEAGCNFEITLDGKNVRTPSKNALLLPTKSLADAIAAEWEEQANDVLPDTMPLTRLANTAIDRVEPRFDLVADEISAFGGTDLLCYRADEPSELVVSQSCAWDPYLIWADEVLGAKLITTSGIMPVAQDIRALDTLSMKVRACTSFELAALHDLTNGFGSLVLALAYMEEFKPFEDVWQASLVDQLHQEEKWGEDSEITETRANLLQDLKTACQFLEMIR